jgi:hypothetical protein
MGRCAGSVGGWRLDSVIAHKQGKQPRLGGNCFPKGEHCRDYSPALNFGDLLPSKSSWVRISSASEFNASTTGRDGRWHRSRPYLGLRLLLMLLMSPIHRSSAAIRLGTGITDCGSYRLDIAVHL